MRGRGWFIDLRDSARDSVHWLRRHVPSEFWDLFHDKMNNCAKFRRNNEYIVNDCRENGWSESLGGIKWASCYGALQCSDRAHICYIDGVMGFTYLDLTKAIYHKAFRLVWSFDALRHFEDERVGVVMKAFLGLEYLTMTRYVDVWQQALYYRQTVAHVANVCMAVYLAML